MDFSSVFFKENCIIAEFYIDEENTNKEVQILNSSENSLRGLPKEMIFKDEEKIMKECQNEKEITQVNIRINGSLIPFCYKYKFQAPGTYLIKYTFPQGLKQTSYLFNHCSQLKKINLKNFDTSNLIKTRGMFQGCFNLESFQFFNTPIEKVIDMSGFFSSCKKLKNITLSNFNKEISVIMDNFFLYCNELETVDLSKFKAKIISAENMFYGCLKIKKIDLSGFISTKESKLETMFDNISSMEKENLITKDQKILEAFDNRYTWENRFNRRKENEYGEGDKEEKENKEDYIEKLKKKYSIIQLILILKK